MTISMETIKDGLSAKGLTYLAPEDHPEVCLLAFETGTCVSLQLVCGGKLLYLFTNPLGDLSSLTDSQQAFFRSRICLWNSSLTLGRVSVEPNGWVILENCIPVDAVSVISSELMVSVIANLVSVFEEKSAEMMLLAVLVGENEQHKYNAKVRQNHRFGNFFSDN